MTNAEFKAQREAQFDANGILFTLDSVFGSERQLWDRTKKEFFFVNGERAWKKWQKEHEGQWATDF
jgi:hypothetical protein